MEVLRIYVRRNFGEIMVVTNHAQITQSSELEVLE